MRRTSSSSVSTRRAFLIETWSRSAPAGLTTKSTAPARIALTTVSMDPLEVWTMTGVARPLLRISARTPSPSSPGMTRSRSTTSAPSDLRRLSASAPVSAIRASKPKRRTAASARRRWTGSSSTMSTVADIAAP